MDVRNPFARDLILLHAPAVYDFRTRPIFMGPVADVVPATAMFEMYPVGITSIAAFLEKNHYNVEIVNLAYRMLRDPSFDVPAMIERLSAPVFGIDLHWLPHAQGALAIAELVKRIHPASRVLMGGLSASYYHEELIRYPFVDFVLRGDSTEEPARQLLQALRESRSLETVANLTWKRSDGSSVVNPLTFVPGNLDAIDVPAYKYLLRSLFKYRSLDNLVPSFEWLRYPITLLLTARGCTQNCAICGGSCSAYASICHRDRPAFRSPEKLMEDVRTIASFSRAPIFIVHDIRMAGARQAVRLLDMLGEFRPANEMIFELYHPAHDEFFETIRRNVPTWSAEITLESPDEATRRRNGKFPVSNRLVEATIESALRHGCHTLDVFFMIGLPGQRREDALRIPEYCEYLLDRFGQSGRLRPFVAPLGPFLDPGSRAFEDPVHGYRSLFRSLEEHRQALLQSSWTRMLSFETDGMTREEIVETTYDVKEKVHQISRDHGVIDQLTWPLPGRFRTGWTLLEGLLLGLGAEARHTAARLVGRYDVAPIS